MNHILFGLGKPGSGKNTALRKLPEAFDCTVLQTRSAETLGVLLDTLKFAKNEESAKFYIPIGFPANSDSLTTLINNYASLGISSITAVHFGILDYTSLTRQIIKAYPEDVAESLAIRRLDEYYANEHPLIENIQKSSFINTVFIDGENCKEGVFEALIKQLESSPLSFYKKEHEVIED